MENLALNPDVAAKYFILGIKIGFLIVGISIPITTYFLLLKLLLTPRNKHDTTKEFPSRPATIRFIDDHRCR